MTVILLCLLGALALAFLAGMRFAVVLREQRDTRRGGYIDLIGVPLDRH
jgi:hypothetical protein